MAVPALQELLGEFFEGLSFCPFLMENKSRSMKASND